jgi:hypothetical protein
MVELLQSLRSQYILINLAKIDGKLGLGWLVTMAFNDYGSGFLYESLATPVLHNTAVFFSLSGPICLIREQYASFI